jgi:putative ATPase
MSLHLPNEPLAERMRPSTLEDYAGQQHLLGEGSVLRKILDQKIPLPSIIFWGPPGVGKTTLARLIAEVSQTQIYTLSAIASGVKDVRDVIDSAARQGGLMKKPVLFIDEIHRFSKSQQDSLLGAVEKGIVTLIGATTENPSFEVIPALLSRCQVYTLKSLDKNELIALLHRALKEDRYLKMRPVEIAESDALLRYSGGDARKLLNLFELVINTFPAGESAVITNEHTTSALQSNLAFYDKNGEQHYDIVSAFIKSMRGSDPNAALYYLARMMEGGEDPKFIARRMLILAAEDIGNANPTAMILANNTFQSVAVIGYPECDLLLAQTVVYLACSPKSNASYMAIRAAQDFVRKTGDLPIPLHLRNAPTKLMKELGYGEEYLYAHSYSGNFVDQEFMPEAAAGTKFYNPGANPRENEMREKLRKQWQDKYGY